jgi:hypothetical protein
MHSINRILAHVGPQQLTGLKEIPHDAQSQPVTKTSMFQAKCKFAKVLEPL